MLVDARELLEVLRRYGPHAACDCGNCVQFAAFIRQCEDAIVAREGVGGLPDETKREDVT